MKMPGVGWEIPFFVALIALAGGCATSPPSSTWQAQGGKPGAANVQPQAPGVGPSVGQGRTEPGIVEINREFQPLRPAQVFADIKDYTSKISEVSLQFAGVPLEVPMENIGGSTWRAQLTPRQLEMLSVSGRTIHYEANVVARDEDGKVGSTRTPIEVAIKTPDLTASNAGAG